jgi:hypothetical protein
MHQTNRCQDTNQVESEGQCDCACASTTFAYVTPSRMLSTEEKYQVSSSSITLGLNRDHWAVHGLRLNPCLAVLGSVPGQLR